MALGMNAPLNTVQVRGFTASWIALLVFTYQFSSSLGLGGGGGRCYLAGAQEVLPPPAVWRKATNIQRKTLLSVLLPFLSIATDPVYV